MFESTSDLLSRVLGNAVAELDIPEDLRASAAAEYERVGNWLADHADGDAGWQVFPQGSFLLGTVVRPAGADEYDLDSVCRRDLAKESTTQAELKGDVGGALGAYVGACAADPDGPIDIDERKRCWTLQYPHRFHLDVLPAIANPEKPPTGILITDRDLRAWQRSDPLAYERWFKERMATELIAKRRRLAEAERVPPAAIPDTRIKTTLQLVVQVLKVHRNEFFAEDLEARPTSILVTTLAAHAYRGERNLYEAVIECVEGMPRYVQRDGDRWLVPNPVEGRENFADKWAAKPTLADNFFAWLEQIAEDLREAGSERGLDKVASRLSESFGSSTVEKAVGRLGDAYRYEREHARLGFAPASGLLSGSGAMAVRSHDFYGSGGAR